LHRKTFTKKPAREMLRLTVQYDDCTTDTVTDQIAPLVFEVGASGTVRQPLPARLHLA
jgi:hypothetical protein